jgi:autotransporter translocation and assembly factor TamB
VEPLWSLAGLHEHELNGHLRGEVRITGSIDAPAFSGSLDLDQGSYSYLTSGLNLQALTLSVTGDGNKLKINAFEATDGQGGSLKAEGAFELSSQLFFPGKVKITATDLSIVDLDSIKALASAQLVYLRSNNTASLSGSVKSRKIEAQLTQTLPISVVSIDVREINLPGRPNAEPSNRSVIKRPPLELDLAVEIPDRFMLRGRGLESEWQGKLSISGTTDVPLINGSATLVRGYFDFGGKHFSLDSGQLFFDGGREIDPRIELISRTRTSSIDAEIKISGNLSSPQVSMSSVPLLPEDEILSQLLFGASITELSAFQLAELASTLATITGKGGNLNFLSAARKRIGLDVLSVSSDPDIENGTLLTGGVYLSKDVFLEVETATSTGEVVTRLFYDISRRLRAESEVSQKKGNSLKLKWFWDY